MENKEERTFETRLLFIKELFENRYSRTDIMASCVNFKLKNSLNNYIMDMDASIECLKKAKLTSVAKKLK